jgi:hypothetical protein
MPDRRIIITRDILRSEMEYALKDDLKYQVEYIWLGAGLHNDLEALEKGLEAAWERIPENMRAAPGIRLMIGQGCLPHMKEGAAGKNVRLLPTKNCLTALLGEDEVKNAGTGPNHGHHPGLDTAELVRRKGTPLPARLGLHRLPHKFRAI